MFIDLSATIWRKDSRPLFLSQGIRARVAWFGITVAQAVAQARRFRVTGADQPASNAIAHTIGTQNNSDNAIQSTIGRNVWGTYRSG